MLHEYFHVLRQWNAGRLSTRAYVTEWLRRGYWANRYERQARRFVSLRLPALHERLDIVEAHLVETGPAIGAHAGRGALVASFQPVME